MAFSYKNSRGDTYFLHERKTGKNGTGKLFYFAKERKENSVENLPSGYKVAENQKTGMPVIKKAE